MPVSTARNGENLIARTGIRIGEQGNPDQKPSPH